jgi:gluconolactonase
MSRSILMILLASALFARRDVQPDETAVASSAPQTIGGIERLSPGLDGLIPPGTEIEVLAEGFDWSEGPVWISEGDYLLFSDIPPNAIYRWKEGQGHSLWLSPSGFTGDQFAGREPGSNGLILDHEGRLLLCQHGDRRIARMDAPLSSPAARFVTIADRWEGARFNSPNDVALHSSGAIYFTDPPYGLEQGPDDPAREIAFQGVYRVSPDGKVDLLSDRMTRPNGIAFSPDERTLYVANSDPQAPLWMAYRLNDEGLIAEERVFFHAGELAAQRQGLPDGLKVDADGNLFATGPGGVLVLSPDGEHLGTILTTQATANCAFGDDGRTLYMTADMYLLRVRLSTRGLGFGGAS